MNEHLPPFQRGEEAGMNTLQRLLEHQEWLKKQHKEVKDKIFQRKKEEEGDEPPIQGFPKD